MKTLFVLFLLVALLGAGYWKSSNPEAGLEEFQNQARSALERARDGSGKLRGAVLSAFDADSGEASDEANGAPMVGAEPDVPAQAVVATANAAGDAIDSALSERLAALEARLDAAAENAAGAPVPPALAELGATQRQLEDRLNSLATAQQSLQDALAAQNGGGTGDAAAVEGELVRTQNSIEAMRNTLRQTQTRVADLGASIDNVSTRVDDLQARLGEVGDGAGVADQDATEPAADGAALAELKQLFDSRLERIESEAVTRSAELAERLDQISDGGVAGASLAAEQRIAQLETSLEQLRTRLGDALSRLDARSNDTTSIEQLQDQVRAQLNELRGELDTPQEEDDINALSAALESTRTRMASLEERVQALPATSSEADDAQAMQDELLAQIRTLEERIAAEVSEFSERGYVTQEELERLREGKSIEYKIYFNKGSTDISDDAAKVLRSFIQQESERTTGVSIYGFTDRQGPAEYNQRLALQRASRVRSWLVQNGFDYTRITAMTGLGEDAAAAIMEDGADDAEQRIVVLYAMQP